jgi:tRNA dimethylallyltransferase
VLLELFGPGSRFEGRAEVVSADSMQAYRGMDIGTAKPGAELRRVLPHHLVDILDPSETFSAGDFVRLAREAMAQIGARGRLPIVSGGTGFYVRNLLLGLPSVPPADPAIRADIASELAASGPAPLRAELERGDPESALRIHENDHYRLTRAVEILRATGRPRGSFLPGASPDGAPKGAQGNESPWLVVELRRPRQELRERIASRVAAMFEAGLPAEVERLRRAGHGPEAPGMKAIGYREFLELEAEGLSGAALLAAARHRVTLDTIHYAKRQGTFFRGLPGLHVLEAGPGATGDLAALLEPLLASLPTEGHA